MSRSTSWPSRLVLVGDPAGSPFEFAGFTKLVPLVVCGGVFALSIALGLFGPIDWRLGNPVAVYVFLVSCLVALTGGYLFAVRANQLSHADNYRRIDPNALMVLGAACFLLVFPFVCYATTGKWFPDVVMGLTDAGRAYATTKLLNETSSPTVLYVKMLLSPATTPVLPMTLFLWSRLKPYSRVLGVGCVTLSLALNVSQGTANGFAETCGIAILFFTLVIGASLKKGRRRRILLAAGAIILIVALFGTYYSTIMTSRLSADIERAQGSSQSNPTDAKRSEQVAATMVDVGYYGGQLRRDSVFYAVAPKGLVPLGVLLTSYLTQGFKGLSIAMDQPFTSTFGLGFSEFFRHNILKFTGHAQDEPAVVASTYAGKITGAGWPVGQRWATFFIHPASDVGFPGVVLLMVLIGWAFGAAWRDVVMFGDPLATSVFISLCLLVFYLSANNQLFQGGERAIGFSVLLVAWLAMRRRWRWSAVRDDAG